MSIEMRVSVVGSPIAPIPVGSGSDRGELVIHALPQVWKYIEVGEIGYCRWENWLAKRGNKAWNIQVYGVRWNAWTWKGEVWKLGATH